MTIDERLEKLTERHEALTLSLELQDPGAVRHDLRRAVAQLVTEEKVTAKG